jgi:capsule polysaccharide modification protein KpsS
VVLLQGPAGPFFRQVGGALQQVGAEVTKVNLCAGDAAFYPRGVSFRGSFEQWGSFLSALYRDRRTECILLFGDCRPYHRVAIEVAEREGIEVWVFEEGYLRPDFVTLEQGGVNGYSRMSKDPDFYRALEPRPVPKPRPVGNTFPISILWVSIHALACTLLRFRYPSYRHHRDVQAFRQFALWFGKIPNRIWHGRRDREVTRKLAHQHSRGYFLVPLQVNGDSQLHHSKYGSVAEFLEEVIRSFAAHADTRHILVVKDHPMDRPYSDHAPLIASLAKELGLGQRIWHVDIVHLPTVLQHARGTVVINSTVGFSSVLHATPTKCLGTAVYDMQGLTHQGSLEDFWHDPGKVDRDLCRKYAWWLRVHTQINGSVWSGLKELSGVSEGPEEGEVSRSGAGAGP